MSTFVLVHGAWHSGDLFGEVAEHMRSAGHIVHTPTLAGNGPSDSRGTGLAEAIKSLTDYILRENLSDLVLLGHSYGGMVITGAADQLPAGVIRRLVYWSAFVPRNGESLVDLVPHSFGEMFDELRQPDGGISMPFPVFRSLLINDGDDALAERVYARLNAQPYKTMTDKIQLRQDPSLFEIEKSFLNCEDDICMPDGWHPKFSSRLGKFRLVSMPGGHEVCFTDPRISAINIMTAGL